MTTSLFEQQLKKFIPNIRFKRREYSDVLGVYGGPQYLLRLNLGDLPLYTHRLRIVKTTEDRMTELSGGQVFDGPRKRGRMQALEMLVRLGRLTTNQAQAIMWGYI
jgi:hypothetical protein